MDEVKRKQANGLLRWGLIISGVAEVVLGVLFYIGKNYVMMGFLAVEGLVKIVLGYSLPILLEPKEILEEEKNEEEVI